MSPINVPGKHRWHRPAGIIAGIHVLPVLLIVTGLIPFAWRFHVLVLMTLIGSAVAFSRHSAESLGFTLPKLRAFLMWSVVPSAVLIAAIFLADVFRADIRHRVIEPSHAAFYLFFVFVSAPAQEFLYRSLLFAELAAIKLSPKAIVAVSTGLFGFMHIIYRDVTTVAVTLLVGLVWAVVFNATRKASIVAVSHAALGAAAIFSGLI